MQYTLSLTLALMLAAVAPARGEGPPNQQSPDSDQLLVAVQRICPVSGQALGGHGPRVRARIGEQIVYVCCDSCLRNRVDAQHWSTVQANLAKAQQKCPVMEKALPEKAEPVVVEGRLIYICCPPCSEKIAGAPQRYFRTVEAATLRALLPLPALTKPSASRRGWLW